MMYKFGIANCLFLAVVYLYLGDVLGIHLSIGFAALLWAIYKGEN